MYFNFKCYIIHNVYNSLINPDKAAMHYQFVKFVIVF